MNDYSRMLDYLNNGLLIGYTYQDPDFHYRIKKVIFNGPATIVFWLDGTKTIVKCGPGDEFDPEKGIAMCFVKKLYNNKGKYNNAFKKWVDEYYCQRKED